MVKNRRSNKWTFIMYRDSAPSDYLDILDGTQVPYALHTPSHVEIVMSASGLYNYFTHAENPEKTKYDPNDIESGCGFDRKKFLLENDYESLLAYALDIIDTMGFTEFGSLVSYARKNDPDLLRLLIQKTYFFSRLLDSMRYSKREEQYKDLEKSKLLMQPKKNNKKRDGDLDR